YGSLILGLPVILGAIFWFGSGRFFWVVTIASSFLGGTFPLLGGSFTPFQVLMMMGIAKYVLEDLVMRRSSHLQVARIDVLLIAGFMTVLTVHGIGDRFGMRFLGSSVWGGRNYVNVYVGLAAFLVVQSIPMKPALWNKLPYIVLGVITFDLAVAIVTTLFPISIYFIYPFYSAVSTGALQEIVTGTAEITGRIGTFGNFGFILIVILLASISLRRLFHPSELFRLIVLGIGSLGVLYSGFRSAVLNTILAVTVAGIRDLKFGVLAIVPMVAVFLIGLSFVNEIVPLPKQVQRGLTFLPGDWDKEMALDAAASDDFRKQAWSLWYRKYFPKHPVLGRGFGFQSDWTERSSDVGRGTDFDQLVETGNVHNGFLATLDTLGILGAIFFIAWNIRLLIETFGVRFDGDAETGFARRFLAIYLAVMILSYWIGASSVGSFLPQEFALAGVFLRLQAAARSTSKSVSASTLVPEPHSPSRVPA
ncbi:MAG: hypothetical protein ACREIF_12990, partial [Chthoniobacterales bacterium]